MANPKRFGLDLDMLKRISKDHLIRILEDSPGSKDLVIDVNLMKLLDRIADASTLRAHGVGRMFRLEMVPPPASSSQLVYIVNPSLSNVRNMCDHVHSFEDLSSMKIILVCIPRLLPVTSIFLEEEGLHGIIKVHEFCPEFISLDSDILSLEMSTFFRDAFLRGDLSECVSIARALSTMENLFGPFTSTVGHGRAAHAVLKTLNLIREERGRFEGSSAKHTPQTPEISHLFVFDRDADFVTPLLTQLTYEGSLDEHFGIKAGIVEFPKEVTGSDHPSKMQLNSQETVFDIIRNKHFGGVSSHLVRRARELQERQQSTSSMTTAQMKDFVSNELRTVQALQKSLSLHLSACEAITNKTRKDFEDQLRTEHGVITGGVSNSEALAYIKDCIARQLASSLSLRLLCLYSIARKGLLRKEYNSISSQFLHAYGFSHLTTLHNLHLMGLLLISEPVDDSPGGAVPVKKQVLRQVVSTLGVRQASIGHWSQMAKKLTLIPDADVHIDLHNPTHMSYIFNGAYVPAIPQLVSLALTNGFPSIQEALKSIPGTTFTSFPKEPDKCSFNRAVLVVILGGVTFGEIAAFRLLSMTLNTKIIIASTNTTTGATLVKSAVQR